MARMPVLQEQKPVIAAWRSAGEVISFFEGFAPLPRLAGVTWLRQR
jgi:hypothetical protein